MTSVLKLDMEMYSFVHLRFTNAEHKLQTRNESQQRSAHFTYNFMFLLRPTVVNWSPWQ